MKNNRIFLAIPLMDEWDNLTSLLYDIKNQTYTHFHVVFCVNQPDHWWQHADKLQICHNNEKTLAYLAAINDFPLTIIDKSSPGMGWQGKAYGVGWARKLSMDHCARLAESDDIIVSLDGDTRFGVNYLDSIVSSFASHPTAVAMSVPYYHTLTGFQDEDRAILRYEIYMRYYALNLWQINSPYSFTALGSALALPIKSYKAIRGMTPNKSGEDFYFLQKLRKYGSLLMYNPEKVYPQARFSERVFFGTGPAMIKGKNNDWSSYPLYSSHDFDQIKQTFLLFPDLYSTTIPTPMDDFLKDVFREKDIWEPIRANHPDKPRFIRACYEKIDGLRTLQFLKCSNKYGNEQDEFNLKQYFEKFVHHSYHPDFLFHDDFRFNQASISQLDAIRNILFKIEESFQLSHYQNFNLQ